MDFFKSAAKYKHESIQENMGILARISTGFPWEQYNSTSFSFVILFNLVA